MKLEEALTFWVSESGYRQIQTVFSKKVHSGKSKYAQMNLLDPETLTNLSKAEDAIHTIRNAMIPGTKTEIYYRGSPSMITQSHIREGFFSVTRDKEKAAEYGPVYEVVVDKQVPRISFSAEGGETLLGNGMVYEYKGSRIYVSMPKNGNIPYLGNLYQSRKTHENDTKRNKYDTLINMLYCYSFETPDEDVGYIGDCDTSIVDAFRTLPFNERVQKLKLRLNELTNKDAFLNDISYILDISSANVNKLLDEVMMGGAKAKTRKTKRSKSLKIRSQHRRSRQRR
jgi:hypothetical protein